jgi:alpha-glucosidase
VQDPYEKNVPGLGLGRDPARTPMQWSPAPGAGFSSARPWLPLGDDYAVYNVESEQPDPGSMLSLYRALLALRRSRATLSVGSYHPLDPGPRVLGYLRTHRGRRDAVLLNLGSASERVSMPAGVGRGRVLVSTHRARDGASFSAELEPDEAVVLELDDA